MGKKIKLLTPTELEMMQILWKLEGGKVQDVVDEKPGGRNLAYTSVSTILRILQQKGFLKAKKEGMGHVYLPLITKQEYESKSVHSLVENVFDSEAPALVRRLLDDKNLTKKDLLSIKELLEAKL